MKRVLYLGYLIAPNETGNYKGVSVAGNKMQWNIVKNLAKKGSVEIDCVTIAPHAVFPHERTVWHWKKTTELVPGVRSYEISFFNLPIIKQLWQILTTYFIAKKLMKKREYDVLFCFNLFPQIGIPMRWLKRKFPKCQTVCLLADLPLDDNTNRRGLSRWLRKLFDDSTRSSMVACDKYVVLNKAVADRYLPGKPFIVIDGGVDMADIEKNYQDKKNAPVERNIMYCGALTEYNGILNLIEAMKVFQGTDIYCDIYGGGYLEEQVRVAAEENENIRFHGRLDNEVVMQKQREAWLLINPRLVNDPIAQVTFPSKTFEYLLSGTPVLTTRLNGYTEEYDGLMVYAKDDSPQALVYAIHEIATGEYQDYLIMAEKALKFVVEKKNWPYQGEIMKQFMLQ